MTFEIIREQSILNATLWLSHASSKSQAKLLPVDLWHHIVSFMETPKLKDYIIINDVVIRITPLLTTMTPLRLKSLIPHMHRKSFGCKLKHSFIALFDLLDGRRSVEEILAL